jgi:RimJ/RimL family protein N-acetyltransferase
VRRSRTIPPRSAFTERAGYNALQRGLKVTDMEPTHNDLGQPIGFPLPGWAPPPAPPRAPRQGRYCRLEPLDPDRHAAALFEADAADADGRSWTYLAYGPFRTLSDYRTWMGATCLGDDPLFFAILDQADGKAAGVASYLRINPSAGSIEVGHIHYSPRLQRSPAATEAMFLLMRWAFEAGYRRYEWKCNALNAASRAAAQRLGLSFEGVFRQAAVSKGRNRDTAWYAAIDAEWPALREAFLAWLDPGNFDGDGRQRTRLSDRTRPLLKQRG